NAFSVVLPWVEVTTGLLLIVGVWRREAALTAGLMLVMFLAGVSWALAHGIDIENCGCFSVSGEGPAAGAKLILHGPGVLPAGGAPRPRPSPPSCPPAPASRRWRERPRPRRRDSPPPGSPGGTSHRSGG